MTPTEDNPRNLEEEIRKEPFFTIAADPDWNACIGEQSDRENYVDGFIQAALILIDSLFEKSALEQRDTLIYPILYTARHGIELTLKMVIDDLKRLGLLTADAPLDHKIMARLCLLKGAAIGDKEINSILLDLEPFVSSLSRIDDDGQELRFHETRDGKKSLADKKILNLQVVRHSLHILAPILKALVDRVDSLERELKTGTYTSDCSRQDLMHIADRLPPRSEWRHDPTFSEVREAVMTEYNLSSNSFSRALNKIQQTRQGNSKLGVETPPEFLVEEECLALVSAFIETQTAQRQGRPKRSGVFVVDEALVRSVLTYVEPKIVETVFKRLSVDQIADMQAVFYLGRDERFAEKYPMLLERAQGELAREDDQNRMFRHIFSKTNFAREFSNGLQKLGSEQLAEKVRKLLAADGIDET